MIIDTHVHFWKYTREDFPWISDNLPKLKRTFLPTDIQLLTNNESVDGIIAIQARQSMEETRWLLELALENPLIKGVVGWVDLKSSSLETTLNILKQDSKLKGFRHLIQDEPEINFMLDDSFIKGVKLLSSYNWVYELLIYPTQYDPAIKFVNTISDTKLVLDHLGKPDITNNIHSEWKSFIVELAKHQNVFCKLSGLLTQANPANWQPSDFIPYLDTVFDAFGTNRLMLGSDWPVCQLAGTYKQSLDVTRAYIAKLSKTEQNKVLYQNALSFYNII